MKIALYALLLMLAAACGDQHDGTSSLKDATSNSSSTSSANPAQDPSAINPAATDGLSFSGYILNAFGVTVDGQPYADLESYYTSEVSQLPSLAKAAGYDSTYTTSFDANVGFADLWTDMTVYMAPTGNQGYQGTSQVDSNGKFSVLLPSGAVDSTYQVRANKRIGVVISKGTEVHNLCYNFSAEDRSVPFAANSQPIILKDFISSITAYDCASETNGGLDIPAKAASPSVPLLQKGMSKDEVLNVLGRADLSINPSNVWCWNPTSDSGICAVNFATACQCSVTFDDKNVAAQQDNISAKFLDVGSW